MELKLPTQEQLRIVYNRDLREAFPAAEMKTLTSIRKMWADNRYRPYCLFDGDEIVGEAFLWLGHSGWTLLDYLCITASRRNEGLGSVIQRAMLETEPPETVIFGEAEAPAYAPDPALAERRIGFYRRNGWRPAGYDSDIFGVHYQCIYLAEREVPMDGLIAEHRYIYHTTLTHRHCRRFIRIPWDPDYQTPRG